MKAVAEIYKKEDHFFELYTSLIEFIQEKYYSRKPVICETLFFPSAESETILTNTIRTAMKTLDVCVFNLTNDKLAQAILEANERGIKVRIITDDEKCHDKGSDVEKFWDSVIIL